jgi:prevent-host-death family protein
MLMDSTVALNEQILSDALWLVGKDCSIVSFRRLTSSITMIIMIIVILLEGRMVTEVNAVNFRQNLGEMLNQVQYRNDSIVIKKDGKPVAALVDAELFARIRRMQDRFDALSGRIAEAYSDVPAEKGLAEIDALIAQERAG